MLQIRGMLSKWTYSYFMFKFMPSFYTQVHAQVLCLMFMRRVTRYGDRYCIIHVPENRHRRNFAHFRRLRNHLNVPCRLKQAICHPRAYPLAHGRPRHETRQNVQKFDQKSTFLLELDSHELNATYLKLRVTGYV